MFVWTVSDLLEATALVICAALLVVLHIRKVIRECYCMHDGGVNETSACDAICKKCGKNLGFIGSWRERQK